MGPNVAISCRTCNLHMPSGLPRMQLKEMMVECKLPQKIGTNAPFSSGIAWSLSVKSLGIVYRSVQLNVWPTYDTYSHTKLFHDRSNTQEHVLWLYGMKQF